MTEPNGAYSDGRTTQKREVQARLEGADLAIRDADGTVIVSWPIADLDLLDRVGRERHLRLTLRPERLARLILRDSDVAETLLARRPELRQGTRTISRGGLIGAAVAAVVIVAVGFALPWLSPFATALVPASVEARIGMTVYDQILPFVSERGQQCATPNGRAILAELIDRLAAGARIDGDVEVIVLFGDMENAFALPGGRIVATSTLIQNMRSADELSGVLAHELGHVAERHGLQSYLESLGLKAILGIVFGGGISGKVGDLGGGYLIQSAYSRGHEASADRFALETLRRAGLTADGLVAFFKRIDQDDGQVPEFFSTHPASASRAALFREARVEGDAALTPEDWKTVRAICAIRVPAVL